MDFTLISVGDTEFPVEMKLTWGQRPGVVPGYDQGELAASYK